MTTTRISKIARLPHPIREQLNHRLQNGEMGRTLVKWLNEQPETKTVMTEHFDGNPITHQNLSDWRRTGYQDWLLHQQRLDWFRHLGEEEADIIKSDQSTDTFEAMSNYFIFELGQAITKLREIKNPHDRLNRLETLTREFSRLQNAFNWSRRVQLEFAKHNHSGTGVSPVSLDGEASVLASRPQIEAHDENRIAALAETASHPGAPASRRPEPQPDTFSKNGGASIPASRTQIEPISENPPNPEKLETPIPLTPTPFQPIPAPAAPTRPIFYSQPPKPKNHWPTRGRRFVCIEG